MFFWFGSLLTSILFAGILGYLALYNDTLDQFFTVSLLFTMYFLVHLLPYVTEIKEKAPIIFNLLVALLASWLYLVIPPITIEYYKYIIRAIGPVYIIVEAAQSVGLSIIIGEKVADWLSGVTDDFARNYNEDRERYGCRCRCREQFALTVVVFVYGLTFWILYKVYMMDSINDWPISATWIFPLLLFGMLLIFLVSLQCQDGTIVQTAMISFFLSYIMYCASQITSKELIANNNLSSNSTNFLLQCSVVLIILLSIPPTMHDLDRIEINKVKNDYETEEDYLKNENEWELKSIFGKSTRLQSFIMAILVLLLTHTFQLWIDFKALSVNLFWYRMCEAVLSIILYLFVMWRDYNSSGYDDI
eukprot:47098_1